MSSKRRKQDKPVKSAFGDKIDAGKLGTNRPTTRSRSRKRAEEASHGAKATPEPAEPLRRSTRKRRKKQFFYPTKVGRTTSRSPKRAAKRKVSTSDDEAEPNDETEITQPRRPEALLEMERTQSSGLALLAEVSNADQLLLSAGPMTPGKRPAWGGPGPGSGSGKGEAPGSLPAKRRREQPAKYQEFTMGRRNPPQTPPKRPQAAAVLDVDVLRKLSIAKLIGQFSAYSSMRVPKDAFSSTYRHAYSCTMLPGVCSETFCGLLADTKDQIKRHLLRHIGELLTMTTQNSQNTKKKVRTVDPSSDTSDAEDSGKDSDMVTYAIPSGTRHVTVNLPRSLDIKEPNYTVIRSSAGANEVVLLPKGCLVSLASVVEELKPHQFGKSPHGKGPSAMKLERDAAEEEDQGHRDEEAGVAVNDESSEDSPDEERLVENFLKVVVKEEEHAARRILTNAAPFSEATTAAAAASSSSFETSVIAPESQTVECDIEIRTKRKKYTRRYDLPREVGKCQRIAERPSPRQLTANGLEAVEPPHADHNYALSVYGGPRDAVPPASPHTDAAGQPLAEPDTPDQDRVSFSPRQHHPNAQKAKRLRKPRVQAAKAKHKAKKEPKPPTEEDKKNRKRALDLLSILSKKSRDRKGPFTCEICNKRVTATGTLRAHYRSHAGIKPFECCQCSATFTRLHSLKYHLMIHNEQTRFMCDHCGREFRHSSHFREHLRRHTGEEPFGCTDCPLRFKTRNTYKRHLKAKHQKKLTAKGISLIKKDKD